MRFIYLAFYILINKHVNTDLIIYKKTPYFNVRNYVVVVVMLAVTHA